jgi:hypothetical protein
METDLHKALSKKVNQSTNDLATLKGSKPPKAASRASASNADLPTAKSLNERDKVSQSVTALSRAELAE